MSFPLLLALSALLAVLLLIAEQRSRRRLRLFGSPPNGLRRQYDLLCLAALLLLTAARSPAAPARPARDLTLALAVDVSASMGAADALPSRLERAKAEIRALVCGLPGVRFALIPFAGEAVLQVPPTSDGEALLFFVDRLETGMVDAAGSAPEEGAAAALALLDGLAGERAVVLFSDGERTRSAPAPSLPGGIPVFAVLLGSAQGSPLPDRQGGLRRNAEGSPVLTRADPQRLQRIVDRTGAELLPPVEGRPAVAPLLERWRLSPVPGERRPTSWLLPLAALLLMMRHLGRRPRTTAAAAALLALLLAAASCTGGQQADGRELFRQALQRHRAGDGTGAAELFARAARRLDAEERALALYDRATLLLAAGQPRNALSLLEEALLLAPGDRDIRTNLALALREIEGAPSAGAGRGTPEAEDGTGEGLSREQALQLLGSVRPAPGAPPATEGRVWEAVEERDW